MAAQKSRHPPWKTISPSVHLDDLRTGRQRMPGNCPAGLQLVARTYWVIIFMAKLHGLFHAWEFLPKVPGVLGCRTSSPLAAGVRLADHRPGRVTSFLHSTYYSDGFGSTPKPASAPRGQNRCGASLWEL